MGEVLSQNEIDNLLAALSTGELNVDNMQESSEKKVRNYDFNRPAKFSKEHLRTLEIINEHYSRLLSTNFPVYLRKQVHVNVASSETVEFSEFTNALSNPVILGVINFLPLKGSIILEISTNLGYAIIDRMLGGTGHPLNKHRELSEIEKTIMQKILIVCTQLLREPWKSVLDISPVLNKLETNPQFAQVVPPKDMVAIVTLDVKIGDVEGYINICLPFSTLEEIMDKLNTKYWFSNLQEHKDEHYEEHIETLLSKVQMPVKAVLGNCDLSVADFMGLQVGDCIRLNTKVDSEMDIYVGNIKKFTALPGASKESYAVRVTSVIKEGE